MKPYVLQIAAAAQLFTSTGVAAQPPVAEGSITVTSNGTPEITVTNTGNSIDVTAKIAGSTTKISIVGNNGTTILETGSSSINEANITIDNGTPASSVKSKVVQSFSIYGKAEAGGVSSKD